MPAAPVPARKPIRGNNLALGAPVTPDSAGATGRANPAVITDGDLGTTLLFGEAATATGSRTRWVRVDLGELASIRYIAVYHATGRTYDRVLLETSVDGTTWSTVNDTNVTGTRVETAAGRVHEVVGPAAYARYVRETITCTQASASIVWYEITVIEDERWLPPVPAP